MAQETQYTANTGMVRISVGNTNLDGSTGTYYTLITGASNGTLIKTLKLKAMGNTTHGMIRFFVYDGTNTKLLAEVDVPAITRSSRDQSFELTLPFDYHLASGSIIKVTTLNSETFNVFAEGLDWTYYGSIRPESTKYAANTGMATISTANSNIDGSTGTYYTILTAANNGTVLQSITIKAQVTTTPGMIRFFINDGGGNTNLLTEVFVPAVVKSGTAHSFSSRIDFGGKDFALKSGWSLKASTENGETFNVIAEGLDWAYPA